MEPNKLSIQDSFVTYVVLVGHDYTKQLSLLLLYMVLSIVGNILITNIGTQIISYGPEVLR
jgi:hypothetical protein